MNTITLFILFIPILVVILLIANLLLAVHRPDSEKVTPYECGFSPVYGQTRNPFSISFYLVGILFLVFDLEILLVYPMASTMYTIGAYGFWIFIIFFIILTIGFVYEFGSGALYFTDKRSNINVSKNDKTVKNSPFTIQRRMYHTTKININNKDINNYLNQVFEKDNGQVTDNVHLIARRHIASTNISDHTIICNNAVNNLSTKVICELLYYKVPVGQATLLENFSLIIRHLNINRVKIFSFIVVNYNRCYATYAPLHGGFMNVFVNALNANPGMSSESFFTRMVNAINPNSREFNNIFELGPNSPQITLLPDSPSSSTDSAPVPISSTDSAPVPTVSTVTETAQEVKITNRRDWEGEWTTNDSSIFDPSTNPVNVPDNVEELRAARVDHYRQDFNIRSPFEEDSSVMYQDSTVAIYMCEATTGIVGIFILFSIITFCINFIKYKNESDKLNSMFNNFYFNFTYYSLIIIQVITGLIMLIQSLVMFNIAVDYLKSIT